MYLHQDTIYVKNAINLLVLLNSASRVDALCQQRLNSISQNVLKENGANTKAALNQMRTKIGDLGVKVSLRFF
jgi:thiaminase